MGYAVGDARIMRGAEGAAMPFNVNIPAQAGALAALNDDAYRRASLELVRSGKRFVQAGLEGRGIFHYPTEANFICLETGVEAAGIWEAIAERGISVRVLASFGLPRMIRFTFGTQEDNRRLLEILDELL